MAEDQTMTKCREVETLELKGSKVELAVSDEAAGTIGVDARQESAVVEDRSARKLTLTGYTGRVALSMWGHVEIYGENSQISGVLVDGHIKADGVDLKCEALREGGPAGQRPVPPFLAGLATDAFGVFVATSFYVLCFAVVSKVIGFDPLSSWWLSLEVVLGAGTYFGYSGHSVAATVIAVAAIAGEMYNRTRGLAEAPCGLGGCVAMFDIIKLGIFFGIMVAGKIVRDYVESYSRRGWAGLRRKLSR